MLYWLPLGAGGRFVRFNGKVYERICALAARRRPLDLYHSALIVTIGDTRWAIELCPERRGDPFRVAGGAVGSRLAGRLRIFRYEARCAPDGEIPDVEFAVESPVPVTDDAGAAGSVLALTRRIPTPVWGRDELSVGEMWNSNSVIAWLLASAGLDLVALRPPAGGRAPGWDAGAIVAGRAARSRRRPADAT